MTLRGLVAALRRRLVPEGSVSTRTVRSGVWATLANGADRLLRILKLVVVASFLAPAEFGLAGLALLAVTALRRVTTLGLDEALVHHEAADVDDYLDTAWALRLGRGLLIGGALLAAAPLLAVAFGMPRLTPVVRALAVLPLLTGLRNPGLVYLQKDLAFHREFGYRVGGSVADATVAIAGAVVLGNVWALVYGSLAGAAVRLVLSYVVHDYRPWPTLDTARARELLGFGKWITASGLLVFLVNEGDDVFVGWFIGAGALGLYQFAYRLSNAPATEITHVVSRVVFPAYSQLQDDTDALRRGYFETVRLTTYLAFPAAVGIALVAPSFVAAFLGPEWAGAVVAMQLLAAWGAARALGATTGPLFRAVGRPDLSTKIQFGKLVLIAAAIYPAATRFGIEGVAFVVVANAVLFSEPVATWLAVRTVEGSYTRFLRVLAYPVVGSLAMACAVLAVDASVSLDPLLTFVTLVATGVASYALVTPLLMRGGYDIVPTVRTVFDAVGGGRA